MVFDTQLNREYYEEKAESNLLLRRVVAGETTFTECLEERVTKLLEKPSLRNVRAFKGLTSTLSEVFPEVLDVYDCNKNAEALRDYKAAVAGTFMFLPATVGMAILLFIPPFTFGEALFPVGPIQLAQYFSIIKRVWKTRKNPEEVFAPIYAAAEYIDGQIGDAFMYGHFQNARNRFGQTYLTLSREEREAVDKKLYALLGVGGMPGMDEIQLNDYLAGLLAPEAEGDV